MMRAARLILCLPVWLAAAGALMLAILFAFDSIVFGLAMAERGLASHQRPELARPAVPHTIRNNERPI